MHDNKPYVLYFYFIDIIYLLTIKGPGARPTTDISIEFEIQWNFVMLLYITYSADHNDIVHTSRQ